MRSLTAVFVLGLVLLGLGFAAGTEPTTYRGLSCGSVLVATDQAGDGRTGTPAQCRSTHRGDRWLATWGPLALGGLLLAGAWVASREGAPAAIRVPQKG